MIAGLLGCVIDYASLYEQVLHCFIVLSPLFLCRVSFA